MPGMFMRVCVLCVDHDTLGPLELTAATQKTKEHDKLVTWALNTVQGEDRALKS